MSYRVDCYCLLLPVMEKESLKELPKMPRSVSFFLMASMAVCSVPASVAGTYSQVVLGDNPIAYYRLDEAPGATQAVDFSVNAHNGVYGGRPTLGVP